MKAIPSKPGNLTFWAKISSAKKHHILLQTKETDHFRHYRTVLKDGNSIYETEIVIVQFTWAKSMWTEEVAYTWLSVQQQIN
jgi:hypothetical protein